MTRKQFRVKPSAPNGPSCQGLIRLKKKKKKV